MKPYPEEQTKRIFTDNLLAIMRERSLTNADIARMAEIDKSTVSFWLSLKSFPTPSNLERLFAALDLKPDALLSDESGFARKVRVGDLPKGAIPAKGVEGATMFVYGRIAAGEPIEMCDVIEEVEVPVTIRERHPYAYFLIVVGDSMDRKVPDGHYAMIDPRAEVNNGDIAAVNVNGYDATLKIWHKTNNSVVLSPKSTNPEHKDIVIDETNPDAPNLRVLGKYIMSMSPYEG